jgi:hypothetical protein
MTFLKTVAADLLQKNGGNLADLTIVFPNKRASLFFNQALVELSDKPVWCPAYASIDDLFTACSELKKADHIWLVMELYEVYVQVTGFTETLEEFYSWGELMLADFDDVDKHLADARQVFSLIGDLHALDNVDYLSEEQRKVLEQFFSNFTKDHNSTLKKRFQQLWNKFYDIYTTYQKRLEEKGVAYEGMLYRKVIENEERRMKNEEDLAWRPESSSYVFVGFNLLNDVEQKMFSMLMKEGRAKFYWDFDDYYMKAQDYHEAGKYISSHLRNFPNELEYDSPVYHRFLKDKEMTFISSATDDLQARYITQWLTPERIAAGRRTAIVLADEQLLETVLHCLPPEVEHVNITTGYPLAQAPAASFVRLLMNLHAHRSYTLHNVNAVLRHPYTRYISEKASELHERLNGEVIYYPTLEDLSVDENLHRLFAPVDDMCAHLMWAVRTIAQNMSDCHDDFHSEGLFRMYTILNRLHTLRQSLQENGDTMCSEMMGNTSLFPRLLAQIIQTTTIPFHGEPIEGIQIMGVLETRNLDFDHLLILSCNEGCLPAKVSDSSFIPHSVRRAYNLTTVENKVGIYSYYFHRLLARAKDAVMIYNNSTEDGRTGEMSRFMLQLLAESGMEINRQTLVSGQVTGTASPKDIVKTEGMIEKLLQKKSFSPSALGKYLRCPISFYYQYVQDIMEDDESDEEEMDSRMFGNIFHKSAELLYGERLNRPITRSFIEGLLNEKGHVTLQRIVDKAFREELFRIKDDSRKTPRLGGLQVVNREMVLRFFEELLRYDLGKTPFTVMAVEERVEGTMEVETALGRRRVKIGGVIDRLDCVTDEDGVQRVRVIDYKTGRAPSAIAMESISDIFLPAQVENHSGYFLQALLYSGLVKDQGENRPISPCVLYVQNASKEGYSPNLLIEKVPRKFIGRPILDASEFLEEFQDGVRRLLTEILSMDQPFRLPEKEDRCHNCAFERLCY